MRNDLCSLEEAVNSARMRLALGYIVMQASSKWKCILKRRIGSERKVKFLKTLSIKMDNEIEVRVRNVTFLKR